MNILLVDKRVQDYETIVAAIDPALAVCVVFDYYEDTFDTVKARIGALGLTNGTTQISVGLIQHNYRVPIFTMLASADVAPIAQVAAQDPELERWTQFRYFITWCKTEFNAAHFDMMACALYSNPDWKYIIDTLATQTGITVRASTDDTGAASLGGDWFLESHTGVNLKTVYFTEAIEAYQGVLFSYYSFNVRNYLTKGFAIGNIQTWGNTDYGGIGVAPSSVTNANSGVVAVYSTEEAFAALKTDGSVVAWGRSSYGGSGAPSSVTNANSGVVAVYSTAGAFAALKNDGSVVAWGSSSNGGTTPGNVSSGVVAVYSAAGAFAALKNDGSVVAWGDSSNGGTTPGNVSSGVVAVHSAFFAFAALKNDGSVVAWGNSLYGGTTPGNVSSGVVAVYSTWLAFAALKNDGSVIAWGDAGTGGTTPGNVSSGVVAVYSTEYAFAALKTDGSVVAWGNSLYGGSGAPSSVTAANSGVLAVYSNIYAFAALKNDGSVVAWGRGGVAPSSVTDANSGVVAVYSNGDAFAALKNDGSVVAWGDSFFGGGGAPSSVTNANSGVVAVYSTVGAFAALKNDGSVVAWGNSDYGGSGAPSSVTAANSGVVTVCSNNKAFAALKTAASTFDISMSYYTNADRYNILRKKENRRRVNLTTINNNVFTLSSTRDLQVINPNIPAGKTLNIIVPTYVASSYSITSTATIPTSSGDFIVACDESEPVTISGTTYVNYGSYVYKRETNNTYTKTTSVTINETLYGLYGGDGITTSGIVFLDGVILLEVSTFSASTFTVAASKTFGDASFAITTRPTSNSSGAITYSSSNTSVATIDASGNFITLVGAGDVSFNAIQAATSQYASATKTSNILTVARATSTLLDSSFSVASSKTFGDAPFSFDVLPTSNSDGQITYSSGNTNVATVDPSGTTITLVGAGDVSFNATQEQTAQYNASTKTSNILSVARATSTLLDSSFSVASSKTFGDAPFSFNVLPTSNSDGLITYSSSNPNVATVDGSGTTITIVGAGDVSFNAAQAQTAQYFSATKTSNTLSVSRGISTLLDSSFSVASSKTFGDAPFSFDVLPTSNSDGQITYNSSNTNVATVDASGTTITLVGAGDVSFNAAQAQTNQYNAATKSSNTLTVSRGIPTFGQFTLGPNSGIYNLVDESFLLTAPTSNSLGSFSYTSDNTAVATIQTRTTSHTTTNLIAKYDATVASSYTLSSGNVTEWRDLTGNGYHLIPNGTGPSVGTINGINALNFGGDKGLRTSSSPPLASAITIFMVIKYSINISRFGSFIHHGNRDTDWSIERDGFNNRLVFESGNNNNVAFDVTNDVNYILIGRIVGTTRQFWRYSNTESTIFSSGTPIELVPGFKQIYVGKSDFGGAVESCNSHIGEILYYNASISNADVSSNLLYLQQKWFQGGLTVIGNSVTFISHGYANITATQDACGNFLSGSVTSPLVVYANNTSTLSGSSFSVAASKTFGDASFAITTRPTSNNTSVPIVYSSSNTNVATIDASGNFITLVGAGDVSFNASQERTTQYNAATKTSNILSVARGISTLLDSSFSVASSKTFGDAAFSFDTLPTSNNTSVPIVYSSSNTNVATVDASGTTITLVGAGDVSFNAAQAQTAQYFSATKSSNTLTISRGTTTLAFVSPPTTKNVIDDTFTVVANSESSGAVTYTSSNPAVATVGLITGLVTLLDIGSVTITAAQAASSQYNAPTNATCTFTIEAAASLSGQTVTISLANKNLTGTSFVNTTLNNISLAGANLSNVNFSGASIIGTNFTNANISGATNLPVFSTAQKIQLMRNANNSSVNAIQISTTLSGAEINAIIATPISYISAATFVVKAPSYNVSNVKVVTVTPQDLSNKQSIYIPMNTNETVEVNGIAYTFDGTNILNSSGSVIQFINILENPFRVYAGSIVALNVADELNNIKIGGDGLYNILTGLFAAKT